MASESNTGEPLAATLVSRVEGTPQTPTLCPSTSGAARWADEGYGHVKITFPVPTATNTEWGWDYVNPDLPPKLHIKIRVKRT